MSYFGFWPSYKVSKFRGLGELLWKAARISWKIDRVGIPLVLPPLLLFHYFKDYIPHTPKELSNPYTEAYQKRKEEGKYNGSLIGLRPERYI